MIELGHFLPGAALLTHEKGVNETYRGTVEIGSVRFSAFVKLLPSRQLVNELFASVLGRLIGLPLPRGFLVVVRREDYPDSPLLMTSGLEVTHAFAVEAVGLQALVRRLDLDSDQAVARLLSAWSQWPDAVSFDDWIANRDRHAGNLLVGAPGEVWLIDHSHAFTGDNWSAANLIPEVTVRNQLCEFMCAHITHDEKRSALQASLSAARRFATVDSLNAAHASYLPQQLTQTDLAALTDFVSQRPASVARRIAAALGIPALPLE